MHSFLGLVRGILVAAIFLVPGFAKAYTVVFQVDMNTVYGYSTPYVSGTFNNWCGICNPMTDANHDGIWEASIQLAAGDYEYKFSADNWSQQESLPVGSACTKTTDTFTNRTLTVSGNATIPLSSWGACGTFVYFPITFQVNMNSVVGYTLPTVKGAFNNWCWACNPLTDPDGDKIFTATVNLKPGEQEFKFSIDNGATEEMFTSGMPCTKTTGQFVNRVINVSQAATLDAVCWATCQTGSIVAGPAATVTIAQTVGTSPACEGTLLTFAAKPQNLTALPLYRWKVDGVKVGANTPTFSSASLRNGQSVTCDIIGASGCGGPAVSTSNTISVAITARVAPSVAISSNSGATFCAGQPVVFTATPTNGGDSPSYQWQLNGANVGTNSNTFTTSALQLGQKVTCILTSNSTCINTPWQQVWADEFNGTSLDSANWVPEVGPACCNNELQYYTANPNNIVFENGQLRIVALKQNLGGRQYTSARLKTQGKFSVQFGRIEGKMKVPVGQGIWPAFWMLGTNINTVSWPKCGEIDIMEHVNSDNKIYGTPHWDNNGHVYLSGITPTDMSIPHVFAVEWDSLAIKFFVDDVLYHTHSIVDNPSSKDEFTKPFFLLLNLAIGGDWPGSPNATTTFPSSFDIDYVRVLKKGAAGTTIDTSNALVLSQTSVTAPTIAASGPTALQNGGSVVLTATTSALNPTYLWSNGATTQAINVTTAGSFTVRVVAGACTSSASAPTVVSVVVCPDAPTITTSGSTTLCPGQNVRLTSSATTGNLWSIGNITSRTVTLNTAGTYTVRQVANGCTSAVSAAVVLTVISTSAPVVTTSGPTTLCGGATVTLTSSLASNNLWSTGETTKSVTVATTGSYTVRGVVSGCSTNSSPPVAVTVTAAPPAPTITASGPTTLCPGTNVRLSSSATYGNLWNVGNLTLRTLTLNSTGTYSVRQIVGACTTAASVPVSVVRLASCATLVREGDGSNEEALTPFATSLKLYPNPVSGGSFTVQSESELSRIRILSVTGAVVYTQELSGYLVDIHAKIPTGSYVAEITTATGTQRKLASWQ